VIVTLLSLGMAAALSVIVWRMLRDDRPRSDARVRALAELAREPAPQLRLTGRSSAPAPFDLPLRPAVQTAATAPPTIARPAETHPMSGTLFAEAGGSSPWGRRVAIAGAVGLGAAALVLFVMAAQVRTSSRLEAREAAASAARPLELLSLRDSRDGSSLVIRGLVQNPRGGTPLNRVIVTAFTFDTAGNPLANARALIDVTALAPGDESPFVVSVPITDAVARYRIGFRTEDGRVISHVDRRPHNTVAANW
jgi:hypothetical protein